jgi:hypothetical protein
MSGDESDLGIGRRELAQRHRTVRPAGHQPYQLRIGNMVGDRPARQQGPGAAVLNLRAMQTSVPSDRDQGNETMQSAAADRLGGR